MWNVQTGLKSGCILRSFCCDLVAPPSPASGRTVVTASTAAFQKLDPCMEEKLVRENTEAFLLYSCLNMQKLQVAKLQSYHTN